jgi:hypothetical protein
MNTNSVTLEVFYYHDILNIIRKAQERIIFIKQAFFKEEIESILQSKKESNVNISLFFEKSDKPIREGFGDKDAIELIHKNIELIDISHFKVENIAILIVDKITFIFTPPNINVSYYNSRMHIILLNEKETALFLQKHFRDKVDVPERSDDKSIGDEIQSSFEDEKNSLEKLKEKLEKDPPLDRSKLEKVKFYRNNYKILKRSVCGIRINNKSLSLRPFNAFSSMKDDRLKRSWTIFTKSDVDDLQDLKAFEKEYDEIINKYKYEENLIVCGTIGDIVKVDKKDSLASDLKLLEHDYIEYLNPGYFYKRGVKDEKTFNRNKEKIMKRFTMNSEENSEQKKSFQDVLDSSFDKLKNYLIGECNFNDENKKAVLKYISKEYKSLDRQYNSENDVENQEKKIGEFMDRFIYDKLKFPDFDDLIETFEIKLVWYDISEELIFQNKDFQNIVKEHNLGLRTNSVGYQEVDE